MRNCIKDCSIRTAEKHCANTTETLIKRKLSTDEHPVQTEPECKGPEKEKGCGLPSEPAIGSGRSP